MKDYIELFYIPGNKAEQALSSIKHTHSADSKIPYAFFLEKKTKIKIVH